MPRFDKQNGEPYTLLIDGSAYSYRSVSAAASSGKAGADGIAERKRAGDIELPVVFDAADGERGEDGFSEDRPAKASSGESFEVSLSFEHGKLYVKSRNMLHIIPKIDMLAAAPRLNIKSVGAGGLAGKSGGDGGSGGEVSSIYIDEKTYSAAGGYGGHGGHGGHGGDGGDGGNVDIVVQHGDEDLFYLVNTWDLSPGMGGGGGKGGQGGSYGAGSSYGTSGLDGIDGLAGAVGKVGKLRFISSGGPAGKVVAEERFRVIVEGLVVPYSTAGYTLEPGMKLENIYLQLREGSGVMPTSKYLQTTVYLKTPAGSRSAVTENPIIDPGTTIELPLALPDLDITDSIVGTEQPYRFSAAMSISVAHSRFPIGIFEQKDCFSIPVAHPVGLSKLQCDHKVCYGYEGRAVVSLENWSHLALGYHHDRDIVLTVSANVPAYRMTFTDHTLKGVFQPALNFRIDSIKSAENFKYSFTYKFSDDITATQSKADIVVSAQLAHPVTCEMREIQRVSASVIGRYGYQTRDVEGADILFVINHDTSPTLLEGWKKYCDDLGLEIVFWDLSIYNGLNFFDSLFGTDQTLLQQWQNKVVLVFPDENQEFYLDLFSFEQLQVASFCSNISFLFLANGGGEKEFYARCLDEVNSACLLPYQRSDREQVVIHSKQDLKERLAANLPMSDKKPAYVLKTHYKGFGSESSANRNAKALLSELKQSFPKHYFSVTYRILKTKFRNFAVDFYVYPMARLAGSNVLFSASTLPRDNVQNLFKSLSFEKKYALFVEWSAREGRSYLLRGIQYNSIAKSGLLSDLVFEIYVYKRSKLVVFEKKDISYEKPVYDPDLLFPKLRHFLELLASQLDVTKPASMKYDGLEIIATLECYLQRLNQVSFSFFHRERKDYRRQAIYSIFKDIVNKFMETHQLASNYERVYSSRVSKIFSMTRARNMSAKLLTDGGAISFFSSVQYMAAKKKADESIMSYEEHSAAASFERVGNTTVIVSGKKYEDEKEREADMLSYQSKAASPLKPF